MAIRVSDSAFLLENNSIMKEPTVHNINLKIYYIYLVSTTNMGLSMFGVLVPLFVQCTNQSFLLTFSFTKLCAEAVDLLFISQLFAVVRHHHLL